MQTPIKINALGPFACKVRREIGNCEQFQKCEARWDIDKNAPCSIDPDKMSKATTADLVELIRDRVGAVTYSEKDERLYQEIDELFDILEDKLAAIVGAVGIGQQPWIANIKNTKADG